MYRTKHACMFLAALALCAATAWAAPTRLQVFVTGDEARANLIAAQLDEAGYGPAVVQPSGAAFRVLTRAYDSYAEANFAKPRLVGLGYNDAFAVAEAGVADDAPVFADAPSVTKDAKFTGLQLDFHPKPAAAAEVKLTARLQGLDNASASEADLFDKALALRASADAAEGVAAVEAFLARFPQSPNAPKAALMAGYWQIRQGNLSAAKARFEQVAAAYPAAPGAGEAALRIGYLMIREQAGDAEILGQFLKVAKADVPASDEVRLEAMLRAAALFHRGKDLETADAAYRHIERFAAGDAEVKAFARMQRAGLTMEKAWNGKATFSQARQLCDELLAEFPAVNKQTRATAALMAMETLCYEKDFAPVLGRGNAFLSEFNDTPEAPLAYYWIAKARLETGDAAGAAQLLDAVIEADFDTSARFKRADLAPAAKILADQAKAKLGKQAKGR